MHLCVNVLLLTGVGNSKFSLANHRATWQLTDSELKREKKRRNLLVFNSYKANVGLWDFLWECANPRLGLKVNNNFDPTVLRHILFLERD